MIKGVGIDVVEISRIQSIINLWGDRFLQKIFTQKEIGYATSRKNSIQHF